MAVPFGLIICIESQFGSLLESENLSNYFLSLRTLNCNLTPIVRIIYNNHVKSCSLGLDPLIILVNVSSIDNKQEMIRFEFTIYQKVIYNTTILMKHHSIKDFSCFKTSDFISKDVIYKFFRIRTADKNLTHV